MAKDEVPAEEVDDEVAAMLADLKKKKKKKKKKKDKSKDKSEILKSAKAGASSMKQYITAAEEGDIYPYQQLLDNIYGLIRAKNPDLVNKKRAVLRPPQVMRVGTSKILWVNYPEICKMMKRDPEHVFRFFLAELGTTGSIDGNQRFMIKGKYVPSYINSLLKKYIGKYVTCPMCKGVDTTLDRDSASRMYFMHCSTCGASKAVATIQKGYHATGRGERRAARNAAK